jgi:F0F1-type ATP synthase membrane subunit b/b'
MSAPESYPNTTTNASATGDDLASSAKQDLAAAGDEIKERAAELGEQAKAQAGEIAEKAKGMADEQREYLAEQLGGVSEALQNAASDLEGRNHSGSQYVRLIADGADKLTANLRDKNVDDLLGMAQEFGRKQPVAFLGAAALLGFAASRFVAASADRRESSSVTASSSPESYAASSSEERSDVSI